MEKPPKTYIIRKAKHEDIDKVVIMFREQFHLHHKLNPVYFVGDRPEIVELIHEYIIKSINESDPLLLVAEGQEGLVGFITFKIQKNSYFDSNLTYYGEVIEVYVCQSQRKSGLGKRLIKEAENYFKKEKCEFSRLAVCSANKSIATFYDRLGYANAVEIRVKHLK